MIQRRVGLSNLVHSLRVGNFKSKLGSYFSFTTSTQQVLEPFTYSSDDEVADIDWDNLGFGLMPTDYMYTMKCLKNGQFEKGQLSRYGNIELSPASGVLNYGQGLFEGTKAYRKENGNILLFRPDQNAIRMKIGAERMCMPSPSIDQFVDAIKQTTLANKRWVPPAGKGTLYIRPLLMGSGSVLGLAPAPEYTFLIYASPVGNYFKDGLAPLHLYVENEFHRASQGGVGGVKTISNYAPVMKAMNTAKKKGFSDVLYLDSVNKKYLEEVSCCNIFIVKGNIISTPATNGTILPGITRKSIIETAQDFGYKVIILILHIALTESEKSVNQVEERVIPVEELMDADEVFCTGTAVVIAPVGSITYQENRMEYKTGSESITWKLYSNLVGIQKGLIEDKKGWTIEIN